MTIRGERFATAEEREAPWALPASPLRLAPGEVHIWRASLEQPPEVLDLVAAALSEDERERAARFLFEKDRRRFSAARGILRDLVGRYLGIRAEEVRFRYRLKGKPFLETESTENPIRFNLSHSHEMALLAFTTAREVGIDIEWMRPGLSCEQIAARFFSTTEAETLRGLPAESRPAGFFTCWTRKEAFMKARGDGLSLPLGDFDVTLAPGEPARLLRTAWDPAEAARWSLRELAPAPNYAAALAIEGEASHLRLWQWLPWF